MIARMKIFRKLKKRGQAMSQLAGLGVSVAGLAIALTVTFLVISQGQTQICDIESLGGTCQLNQSSLALNATNTLASAVDDIPGWVPLIIVAVVGSILLGLTALFTRR